MKNAGLKNAIHKIIPYMRGSKGDSSLVGLYMPFLASPVPVCSVSRKGRYSPTRLLSPLLPLIYGIIL